MRSTHRGSWRSSTMALAALTLLLPLGAAAQEDGKRVAVHFSGGWAAGDTDGNEYLAGGDERDYDLRDLSVTFAASPHERLRLTAQVALATDPLDSDDTSVEINFAFAEWRFDDLARLRAGIVRHPFGLYSETLETGTLRPFYSLPQGVYAQATFLSPGYRGMGLTGFRAFGDWELEYDLYGGELSLGAPAEANPIIGALFPTSDRAQNVADLIGTRVRLGTPVDGLRVSAGAYEGSSEGTAGQDVPTHEAWIGSIEWVSGPFELRAESAHREGGTYRATVDAWYVEGAYRFAEHWQVAARFDVTDTETATPLPAPFRSLFEHEDQAVGINWWPSPNLVFKLSYHQVEGNSFAFPEELPNLALGETLEQDTDLVQIGVQFSY